MSGQIVDEQNFYDIANAIRRQNGESTLYRPQDMPQAILNINTNLNYAIIDSIIDRSIVSFYSSSAIIIKDNIFRYCTSLITVTLSACISISDEAFKDCTSLTSITLSGPTVCTLENNSAFDNTPIDFGTGYIYVPANLVDTYKAATNWSDYASQIVAISE